MSRFADAEPRPGATERADERSRIFGSKSWQMTLGERAALEGLLSDLSPALSIEIGTAQGGSLRCIAAHSAEVHTMDLAPAASSPPPHVKLHAGDSKEVLPALLARFTAEGRNVDFVLVDGDHSSDGVRTDLLNLLSSPAVARTVIVLHDTMNEAVRAGITAVRFEQFAKVRYVDLDFVAGFLAQRGSFAGELWGGLGLILVEEGAGAPASPYEDLHHDAHAALRALRSLGNDSDFDGGAPNAGEPQDRIEALTASLEQHRRALRGVETSVSWRITAPLRAAKTRFLQLSSALRSRREPR
jgi:hypothetical protein